MPSTEDIAESQSTANGAFSPGCSCVPAVKHRSTCYISCLVFTQQVLLACLHNKFKSTNSSGQNFTCNLEWLKAFLEFSDLRYACITCKQKHQANYLLGKSSDVPAGDSPFVSVSETNTFVEDQQTAI